MSVRILVGDVREKLRELPADSFDCVVTSPPYWGLRDYDTARWEGGDADCDHRSPTMRVGRDEQRAASLAGKLAGSAATNSAQLLLAHRSACGKCGAVKVDSQIGLEPTLGEHLSVMVEVMREVRRVLKPTGTLWLNYGDCYATSPNGRSAADTKATGNDDRTFRDKPFSTIGPINGPGGRRKTALSERDDVEVGGWGKSDDSVRWRGGGHLKAKDLCMVPNRLAIALQEDGWWVRSEIIWAKPNPMPESIKDRPATAHEKIFLLSRAPRYHYDAEAVRRGAVGQTEHDLTGGGHSPPGQAPHTGSRKARSKRQDEIAASSPGSSSRRMAGFNERWDAKQAQRKNENARGFRGGSYVGGEPGPRTETGNVPGTGDRSLRNYEPAPVQVWNVATQPFKDAHFATFPPELAERCLKAGCPAGGSVLDPFGGAGTTGLVADRLGLDCTLIELSPKYAEIARKRLESDAGMFSDVGVVAA